MTSRNLDKDQIEQFTNLFINSFLVANIVVIVSVSFVLFGGVFVSLFLLCNVLSSLYSKEKSPELEIRISMACNQEK